MTLAAHVRSLGRGPGRSRSLTRDEAAEAMTAMLSGNAAPEAVGALLMLLRMKGETAQEIAGFADAARQAPAPLPPVDLDWPSYAAGHTRGAPWFLLSARMVAAAGYRVLLHGWNGADTAVRDGLAGAGIPVATDAGQIARALDTRRIAYVPLESLAPPLFALLGLRQVLGLRSCINTVCRMLNPAGASASVQGVFHPSYRQLQADAAALLGWRNLTVIKGGGGEVECHPAKDIAGIGLRAGLAWQGSYPASVAAHVRLAEVCDLPRNTGLWSGAAQDALAAEIVVATATLALDTLEHAEPATSARALWAGRVAA